MSIDGHQKHSKAVENTGRNSFSTLASTLDLSSPGCCLPQAEVGGKRTYAAAQQRSGMVLSSAVARQRSATYQMRIFCQGRGLVKEASRGIGLSTLHDSAERCGHAVSNGSESGLDRLSGGDCVPQRGLLPLSCLLENHSLYSTAEERVLFFQTIEGCGQLSDINSILIFLYSIQTSPVVILCLRMGRNTISGSIAPRNEKYARTGSPSQPKHLHELLEPSF